MYSSTECDTVFPPQGGTGYDCINLLRGKEWVESPERKVLKPHIRKIIGISLQRYVLLIIYLYSEVGLF